MRRGENTVKMTGILSFMYIMNTYDVWFTREGPVGSGDHRYLHVLESSRDQALEALRGERVRAVNVEFSGQTGCDRSVYLMGRSRSQGTGCGGSGGSAEGSRVNVISDMKCVGKGLSRAATALTALTWR